MREFLLSIKAFCLYTAALLAILLAAGCGSSGDSAEVTVETGTLSKADFIERADDICTSARTQFQTEYAAFLKAHKSQVLSTANQEELVEKLVDEIFLPNYEKQVEEISALGAPEGNFEQEVAVFIEEFQRRLGEVHDHPPIIAASPFPFEKVAEVARKTGLIKCAESFS